AAAHGRHSNIGYDAPKDLAQTKSKIRLGTGADPRVSTAEMQRYTLEETNATTTRTLVDAALRLVEELPEDAPAGQVLDHWLTSARRDDAARGVLWPTIDPEHLAQSGTAWQIFPNFQIGQGLTTALCYSARPHGYDPDQCVFEASCYELYPKGEEPQTEWVYAPPDDPGWRSVLPQDFSNMAAVQQGMKSGGFGGPKPNPYMERSTANLHRNLAEYMGTGAPREL
ncbi:SRPBCC family protein, partial [Mycobacterium marinum]